MKSLRQGISSIDKIKITVLTFHFGDNWISNPLNMFYDSL